MIYGLLVGSKGLQHMYLGMDLNFDGKKFKRLSMSAAIFLVEEADKLVLLSHEASNLWVYCCTLPRILAWTLVMLFGIVWIQLLGVHIRRYSES